MFLQQGRVIKEMKSIIIFSYYPVKKNIFSIQGCLSGSTDRTSNSWSLLRSWPHSFWDQALVWALGWEWKVDLRFVLSPSLCPHALHVPSLCLSLSHTLSLSLPSLSLFLCILTPLHLKWRNKLEKIFSASKSYCYDRSFQCHWFWGNIKIRLSWDKLLPVAERIREATLGKYFPCHQEGLTYNMRHLHIRADQISK